MTSIPSELLESLNPLRELSSDALNELAGEAEYEDFPPKTVIFRKGAEDPWTRYVVSGAVVLVDQPGSERTVVGTGNQGIAADPLGWDAPHKENALSRTDVRLIRLPTTRIRELLDATRPPDYDVDEVGDQGDDAGGQLFYQLFQDLMEDKLDLPSMPDIAVRVRRAISDEDAGAPDVAKILQTDPVVAAQVMKAANSATFAGQHPVDSLAPAIVRLGLKTTREVVMAVTMRDVFKARNPMLNKRMVELWMHSTLVAAIATVLARKLKGFAPDRALLAGLVHDIGVVPMLANAAEYRELTRDPKLLEATISEYRGQVGTMILRRWNFPEDLVEVPLEAEQWHREGEGGYADLVVIAQLQSFAGTADASQYPALTEVPAFERLGLAEVGLSDENSLLDEAREEIAEAQRLLIG